MILGLPLDSWALIAIAVGLGPLVELVFLLSVRRRRLSADDER